MGEVVSDTAVLLSEVNKNVGGLMGKQDVVNVEDTISVSSTHGQLQKEKNGMENDETEIIQLHFNEDTSRESGFDDFLEE